MANNEKDTLSDKEIIADEKYSDKQTDLKIHQHLTNINDEISDEDIKNVRTEFKDEAAKLIGSEETTEIGKDQNDGEDEIHHQQGTRKDKEENKDAHPIISSWNILGS